MTETGLWEEVFSTASEVEAELVRGLLASNGFAVVVRTTGLKAMAAIYGQAAIGEYQLLVPPDQAALARELVEAPPESADQPES